MKLRLILQLSLIGLALALGDVFFIPASLSSILWLALYVFYAYAIARSCRTLRFAHGLLLGLVNSTWITAAHEVFVKRYLERHPLELSMIDMVHSALHIKGSPRDIMSVTGPVSGLTVGCVIGVFAVVAGLMRKPRRRELAPRRRA
jgi:hypothetical protein